MRDILGNIDRMKIDEKKNLWKKKIIEKLIIHILKLF